MKYCFSTLILVAVAVVGMGCEQTKPKQKPQTGVESKTSRESVASQESIRDDEPLLLDDEPLLLDDGPDADMAAGPVADNSRCYVCHINYMQEDITVIHARANIGCADCHGDCDAHIADESWASGGNGTPPGIMYPRPKINPFCRGCHPENKKESEQQKPPIDSTAEQKYCTDCHGDHRLTSRKCKWK